MNLARSLLLLALAFGASAGEVTGKWKAVFTDPSVCFKTFSEITLNLKIQGSTLTGTAEVGSWPGKAALVDGKIKGNEVAFTFIGKLPWHSSGAGTEHAGVPKLTFKGTVEGAEMRLTLVWDNIMSIGDPPPSQEYDMKASRLSE